MDGVGGTGFFSASRILGNDNDGNDNLASGGGNKDFFGSEGNVLAGGGLGISALGSDLTPNASDSYLARMDDRGKIASECIYLTIETAKTTHKNQSSPHPAFSQAS